jgi:hypothetical protein
MKKEPRRRSNSTARRSTGGAYESTGRRRKIARPARQEDVPVLKVVRQGAVAAATLVVVKGAVATLVAARVQAAIDRLLPRRRATATAAPRVVAHVPRAAAMVVAMVAGETSAATIGAAAAIVVIEADAEAQAARARVAVVVAVAVVAVAAARITRTDRPAAASTTSTIGIDRQHIYYLDAEDPACLGRAGGEGEGPATVPLQAKWDMARRQASRRRSCVDERLPSARP